MARYRRADRIPFGQEVTCSIHGRTFTGSALNLSVSGILLCTEEEFPLESAIHLQFQLSKDPDSATIEVQGKVYRSDNSKLGVTFLDLDWKTRERLVQFIRQQDFSPVVFVSSLSRWQLSLGFFLLGVLLASIGFAVWMLLD